MRFINSKTNFMENPVRRALDLMFDGASTPFLTKWDWERLSEGNENLFTVPVGEGWTNDALHLRFSIPGVSADGFTLMHQGNRLMLRGQREKPEDLDSFGLPYGKFERNVELSRDLDVEKMRAELHHGVLDVHIPIQDSIKARTIPVHEAATVAA